MSPGIIYLGLGLLLGPAGLQLLDVRLPEDAPRIEAIAELGLAVGLFCVALRLRMPMNWSEWRRPARLAAITMPATALLVAATAHIAFDLDFPQALLLGVILAPIDPLLPAEVHMPGGASTNDTRAQLAAEGALGALLAVPMLALAASLAGAGNFGARAGGWLATDLLWGVGAAAVIGWVLGVLAARVIARVERRGRDALATGLGVVMLVGLAWCVPLAVGAHGLAGVFAAGLGLTRGGSRGGLEPPRRLSPQLLEITRRAERIVTAAMALLVGALLVAADLRAGLFAFALLLIGALRPIAVMLGFGGLEVARDQRRLTSWFGMRGIVSVYALMAAVNAGLGPAHAEALVGLVVAAVTTSIIVQGISAVPLPGIRLGDPKSP